MKIYIQEENSFFLAKQNKKQNLNKIIDNLDKYLIKKEKFIDIYSKQGIYQINENKVHKLNIKMVKTNENILIQNESGKNIKFLIDDSIIKKELVYQIPYEHISISLHVYKYSLNKTKISLVLVVEFIQNNKGIMIPINYYFEYNPVTSNNNIIPAEDINVFLSLLN